MHPRPPGTTEWRRLFAAEAGSPRPDLSLLCLLIGTEADPSLDEAGMDAARRLLDRLAEQVAAGHRSCRAGGPLAWAVATSELLGASHGFKGRPGDYQRLDSSLLHQVLRRRRGLPILLSVVWMEVARRAGAPVHGIALPGHFIVGFGPPEDRVLADPFGGGRLLSGMDVELLVAAATGTPTAPSLLGTAGPLDIVARILNNIRVWAASRPECSDVSLWAVDLCLLLPTPSPRLHYERAQLLVQKGEFQAGARELDTYADEVAALDPTTADRVRRQALGARAMLN
ncbi:transglutaminase-like domain-containing protein [Streptomyces atriruber]|uniref:transglutaminase family protein n=1 Tax=Streptomyces atriruber TaxID=545121 RepID=UPI0006E2D723|nr:transglutaminase-like domain-containing protein [Streptomyces atriruber]